MIVRRGADKEDMVSQGNLIGGKPNLLDDQDVLGNPDVLK
jgi:hypothetical protein